MELNLSLDTVRACGVDIVSISPDSVENLRAFAEANGISFPMLSDVGAHVIDAFGVRNPLFDALPLDVGVPYPQRGIPYPGHFLLGPDHVIVDKRFTGDLRHRASGTMLVQRRLGPGAGSAGVEIVTGELRATIRLSAGWAFGGQELGVTADLHVAPGWHVYGDPTGPPYTPLGIVFDEELVADQSMEFPPAAPTPMPSSPEELFAHHGDLRGHGRVRIRWNPVASNLSAENPFAGIQVPTGNQVLRGRLVYQACDGAVCLAPRSIAFEISLRVHDNLTYAVPGR